MHPGCSSFLKTGKKLKIRTGSSEERTSQFSSQYIGRKTVVIAIAIFIFSWSHSPVLNEERHCVECSGRGVFSHVVLSVLSVLSPRRGDRGPSEKTQPLDAASEVTSNCGARRQTRI